MDPSSDTAPKSTSTPSILFYKRENPYYEFSNFAHYAVEIDGHHWPTTEHYFQASKFDDPELQKKIREAPSPGQAFKYGRNPGYASKLRKDWDTYRLTAMKTAIYAKFTQHEELCKLLLDTGDAPLVEDSPKDAFWGVGPTGTGKNHLGLLLMALREQLVLEATTE